MRVPCEKGPLNAMIISTYYTCTIVLPIGMQKTVLQSVVVLIVIALHVGKWVLSLI